MPSDRRTTPSSSSTTESAAHSSTAAISPHLERISDGFYALDDEWRFTYVNGRAWELLQHDEEELLGECLWDVFPSAKEIDEVWEAFRMARDTGEQASYERYCDTLDFWVEAEIYPSDTGVSVYFRDVTDARRLKSELTSLNHFHRLVEKAVHKIIDTDMVGAGDAYELIAQTICDHLIDDSRTDFTFAWIGEPDYGVDEVVPLAKCGEADGYLEDITIPLVTDTEAPVAPAVTTIRTHEPQFINALNTDSSVAPWREAMLERGFQSAASIPIIYDEYLYGLLAIYSDRSQTFVGETTETLVRFGKIIGHAIQAGERERALTTDSVVRVEFRNQAMADRLYDAYDDTVDFKATSERIFTVDGRHHLLMRATGVSASKYGVLLEQFQAIEESTVIDGGTDEDTNGLVSITVSDDSATGVIIEHGGMPRSLTFDEDGLTLSADLPPYVDVRGVAEELADLYPGTRMVSKRTVPRETCVSGGDVQGVLGGLTEKQRVALETAHHTGYFEWPRHTTAEEVAELLQISSPTMSEHLRSGQRKVFNAVFDTSTAGSLYEK